MYKNKLVCQSAENITEQRNGVRGSESTLRTGKQTRHAYIHRQTQTCRFLYILNS